MDKKNSRGDGSAWKRPSCYVIRPEWYEYGTTGMELSQNLQDYDDTNMSVIVMKADAVKHIDDSHKETKVGNHSSSKLHKEAVAELASPKGHIPGDKNPVKKLAHDLPRAHNEESKKSHPAEKVNLAPELRHAIEHCAKVVVKMPASKGERVDLLIKSDGKVVPNSDISRKEPNSHLTVGVEAESGHDVSKAQTDALKEVISYADSHKKAVALETSPAESEKRAPAVSHSMPHPIPVEPVSVPAHASAHASARAAVSLRHADNKVDSKHEHSVAQAVKHFSRSEPIEPRKNFESQSDISHTVSKPTDNAQVNIKQLLEEWFTANPEKFRQIMPDLYKALAGADGKLDPIKLSQLSEANNPLLENLRNRLPAIAAEFPQSQAGNVQLLANASDAVSAKGILLADKAAQVASQLGSVGYCAKGVSEAIQGAIGKTITGNANDMRESLTSHGFSVASSNELKVGQIVHVNWTPEVYAQERAKRGNCPNYGDIAIIGKGKDGQLFAFNDHVTPLKDYLGKSRYDWNSMKVFNPPA